MCRDFKLHDEKYLKGAMENEFTKRKEFLRRYEGYDEKSTDTANLYSGVGGELEQYDKFVSTAEFNNGTATESFGRNDNNKSNERFDEQSDRKTESDSIRFEEYINEFSGCDANDSNRFSDECSEPSGQVGIEGEGLNDGNILTGWENEREFFEQSYRTKESYKRYIPQTQNRQLDTDNNATTITGSIRFMGNLANLLSTSNRRFRGKYIKLSQKEIEKRLAHGQKTSGYEEYEDNSLEQSM